MISKKIPHTLSPVSVFVYKRLDTVKQVIDNLCQCKYAEQSELYIFSDGPKNDNDLSIIEELRDYLKKIIGFKKVHLTFSETNKGLATSIIEGVNVVLRAHKSVIVLEDDLIPSSNFLAYMNQALSFFKDNEKIFTISGFTVPMPRSIEYPYDNYFTRRMSSWGWATWENRWTDIDWQVSDYSFFKEDKVQRRAFNAMGSDLSQMLDRQMRGDINSWAIRCCFHQFKNDLYSVYPLVSKIDNIGFGSTATNTKEKFNRYATDLDRSDQYNFSFNPNIELIKNFVNKFISTYSIKTRIFYKILNKFVFLK
ncbi:MAG: glycosyltransferase [Leeuwenhoekiella sp.]